MEDEEMVEAVHNKNNKDRVVLLPSSSSSRQRSGGGAATAAPTVAAEEEARKAFLRAVEQLDSAQRSLRFFECTLEAMRGDGSAESRSCTICLEEDVPPTLLSITVCGHVGHSSCMEEVLRNFKQCPVCRQRLGVPEKDLARLTTEMPEHAGEQEEDAPSSTVRASAGGDDPPGALVRRFGTKLGLMVEKLREVAGAGEKAIVFCQWEDLKRKLAEALEAFGVAHLELKGGVYQRNETIRRFQDERGDGEQSTQGPDFARVLLLSLEQSASGTDLSAANHVFLVHPMCAASQQTAVAYEAQALGRCRRFGQLREKVVLWRFVTLGTVEEEIVQAHRRAMQERGAQSSDRKRVGRAAVSGAKVPGAT